MCGLAGLVKNTINNSSPQAVSFSRALQDLTHRGPDDQGSKTLYSNQWKIELGQTRLSIIDLSQGGHQPFESSDQNWILIFNGEIYNYKELRKELETKGILFRTDSDTEVLLNSWIFWGKSCLPRLKGMFAFAVLDQKNNLITCVRDAFGIKPFFYFKTENTFAFASEISALRKIVPADKINDKKMYEYIAFGSNDSTKETFFEQITNLEPATILEIDYSKSSLVYSENRWWWPNINKVLDLSHGEMIDEVRERFLENVKIHLRSDVPIGVALSGGIDSSSIVSAMRYLDSDLEINTFSFISPGSEKNEEYWIDLVNTHVGAKVHKVLISPNELVRDLDDMIKYQGEPFISTSIYAQYRVYKLAKESGVKVTLDGQGADELFAGYLGYPESRIKSLLASGRVLQAIEFLNGWRQSPGRTISLALQNSIAISMPKFLIPLAYRSTKRRIPSRLFKKEFLDIDNKELNYPLIRLREIDWIKDRFLAARLRHALTKGELTQLLRHGDRNSMRWSIESRVPFLTTDFAEFALSLPEKHLISNEGVTKDIFRDAMRGLVPTQILERKDKIGFETPELEWMKLLKPDIEVWLEGLSEIPWINVPTVKIYFKELMAGNREFAGLIWRLINTARWTALVQKD